MNLLQLRAFDAVARTGGVTAAATQLHVSQPAVTSHIKALEDYYEVSLLRRKGRGVEPTELGEALAALTRRLFTLEEEAADLLEGHQRLERGTLRIAADGPYILIPLVTAFRDRFPGVRVALSIGSTVNVQAALLAERCDVTVQAQTEDDRSLHAVTLARYRIVAFAGIEHPWAAEKRHAVTIRELGAQPLILREQGTITRRMVEAACRRARIQPNVVIETTSRETVKEAVAAGLGIGVISEAELRPDARFWPVTVTDADLDYAERVLCLERRRRLRIVREFLNVTEAVIRSGAFPGKLDADAFD